MARTGGYRQSAVWRPCGVTPHAALQNKSVVCSGSRVTISTVMKLHWSVKRGGIIVKRIQRALAHIKILAISDWHILDFLFFVVASMTDCNSHPIVTGSLWVWREIWCLWAKILGSCMQMDLLCLLVWAYCPALRMSRSYQFTFGDVCKTRCIGLVVGNQEERKFSHQLWQN